MSGIPNSWLRMTDAEFQQHVRRMQETARQWDESAQEQDCAQLAREGIGAHVREIAGQVYRSPEWE
jgi:hypothetical protein